MNAISAGRAQCRAVTTRVSSTRPRTHARGTFWPDARAATTRRTRCGSALRRPWATATGSACGASPPLLAALRLLTRSSRSSWPSASAVGNPEREDSPAYLLKRLFEQENAALRQKKRRDAAAELKDLVTSSSTSRARQTFRRSVPRHSSGSAR